MSLRSRLTLVVGAVLIIGLLTFAWTSGGARPAAAQDDIRSLRTLLLDVRNAESRITFQFARPLISGEATWTLPDVTLGRIIGEVGADFVCFEEPWNGGIRSRCTPFNNIISLDFTRPASS